MKAKTYSIKKIFGPTLQSEGTKSGYVVKFLRFTGCNKWSGLEKDRAKSVCWYCDTDFRKGTRMTSAEIVAQLDALGPVRQLVISGGEPTLQLDEHLLLALTDAGYHLHLETNGSVDLDSLSTYFDHITLSPKQPLVETKLQWAHDVKVLYPEIHKGVTLEDFNRFPARNRYLQPVHSDKYEDNLQATIRKLYENPEWRLSLQTHKFTGVE